MAKIRMIVIEGEMSVDDVRRLAQAFSADDATFTSVTLPNGVTAQAATLAKDEQKPRPRPIEVPVVAEDKPVAIPVVEAPSPVEVPAAVAAVFPEAEVAQEEAAPLLESLLGCKRLAGILEILQQAGHEGLPALIEACKTYRDNVPLLQRLGEGLEDRVTRTFEGMK